MRLNADKVLASASSISRLTLPPGVTITTIDEVVDTETGDITNIALEDFRGTGIWEIVEKLHDRYSGDTAFIIEMPGAFALVRPAFSELPIYYRIGSEVVDAWSGLELPEELLRSPPSFDLDYLSNAMLNWSWVTPRTGFQGVFELLSGAALVFDGKNLCQRDYLANIIINISSTEDDKSYGDQVQCIRTLILNSVKHKIGRHLNEACVLCSGGLDSTVGVVAAKVLYPDHQLPLIHCYSIEHWEADERFYVNSVARRTGWPAATVDMDARASRNNLTPELLVATARPVKSAAAMSTMASLKGLARENGARIMLSGDGGDQLFLLNDPMLFGRELLHESKTLGSKVRMANEISSVSRRPIWEVAKSMLYSRQEAQLRERYFGKLRFPESPFGVPKDRGNIELVPNGGVLASIGISRAFQFFGMRNAELNSVPVKGYEAEERKTCLFWPLVKRAIRAKRSFHLRDKRDRALERDAFRNELPPEVFYRVGKGGSRDFAEQYDFADLVQSLSKSPLAIHGLIPTNVTIEPGTQPDANMALALLVARGFSDWMEIYA